MQRLDNMLLASPVCLLVCTLLSCLTASRGSCEHVRPGGTVQRAWQRKTTPASSHCAVSAGAGMGYRHEDPKQHIAVLSGIPTNPCALPWGDWYVSMAMQNHQVLPLLCDAGCSPCPAKVLDVREPCWPAARQSDWVQQALTVLRRG